MAMGVPIFVNAPADTTTTENQTTSKQQIKIYPYDFTTQDRKTRTFKLISRVRDIMNVIQGPKIMDINIAQSNDVNVILTHDGAGSFLSNNFFNATNPEVYGFTTNVSISLRELPKLFVRRDGENANAITAIDFMTTNYDEQASRITSNAPSDSMYSYPFIFSNYTLDPALRPLCVSPILKWLWTSYTLPSIVPQVSVLKLDTLNRNIQSSTLFPNAQVPFPNNVIAVDCSTLTSSNIGKLYKLSPFIVDVSNSHEGLFNAVASAKFDADIALALDHTYTSQDIEFALFLGSLHFPNNSYSSMNSIVLHNYRYDPVEAIFSYFSTKKYEFTDNPLHNISLNTSFKLNIIYSNRLAVTYMIQQAAKQMKIWLDPSVSLAKGIYTSNQINNALAFNTDIDLTQVVTSEYINFPIWIPYEYVKSSNNEIEFDQTTWISGRGNRKIAKHCVKPASYRDGLSTTTYYNKFGEAYTYTSHVSYGRPTSLYVPNLPDRCIYTAQTWNDDNLYNRDYLEESDYFPAQDLVFDI